MLLHMDNLDAYIPEETMNIFFAAMDLCKGVEDKSNHHPETDVLNHLLQVFDIAVRESNDVDLVLAAMLHDVGKYVSFIDHSVLAVELLQGHLSKKTEWLIENHMRIHYLLDGETKKLKKIYSLIDSPWIGELVLLARWDKLGRKPDVAIPFDKGVMEITLIQLCKGHFLNKLAMGSTNENNFRISVR